MGKARRQKDTIIPEGYIYKISSADDSLVYYGATDNFETRMSVHKSSYKRYLNNEMNFLTVFEIIKLDNYKMEIYQTHKNIKWQDLLDIETDIIFNNPCVNKNSKKDSRSPEYIKNHNEKYNKENAAKLNEKFLCCECPGRYTHATKSKHFKTQIHIKALKLKLEQQQKQIDNLEIKVNNIKPKIILKLKPKIVLTGDNNTNNINITSNN